MLLLLVLSVFLLAPGSVPAGEASGLTSQPVDPVPAEKLLGGADMGLLRDTLDRPPSPTRTDANGWTDLHYAAALNRPEAAAALLDAGAEVDSG